MSCEGSTPDQTLIELTYEPIDYPHLTEAVRDASCGAVTLFLGTVREFTAGRQTVALSYEAYEAMATNELHRLVTEAREFWPIRHVGIIHRLGALELGEIAIALAVSSPHRQEAFEAAQSLMNRIKETVPIWKKERWADGSTEWVHPQADQ